MHDRLSFRVSLDRSASPLGLLLLASCVVLASLVAAAPVGAETTELPETVGFAEHVAPVLFEHCITCHRPGDVAPMSLLSWEEARPWAKSIRKAVATREMPPWDADPRYGEFSNDISLSDHEIAIIERWVDQGGPSGDLSKMPQVPDLPAAGSWRMGREPDVVVELAPIDVPADGPDLFVTQLGIVDIPEGKWLQAVELLPGNTAVLHHVVTYLGPFGMNDDEDEESNAGVSSVVYLDERAKQAPGMAEAPKIGGVWVAGSPPSEYLEGTGHDLATEQRLSFNMHYHPSGNAGTDASKVGLYFGEGEMQKEIQTAFAANPGMFIPAGAGNHEERALYLFARDSQILSLLPHMHNRGKSMRYTLEMPDGSKQVILDVPEYDYDWQNIYHFEEPVRAPAGSVLVVDAVWDNSADNPANPDPTIDVPWGDGTNNEMLVAFVDYVADDGQKVRPIRSADYIDQLLARHDPEEAYLIKMEGMGFGGEMGLVLPEKGEGWFYMGFGNLMFSTSLADVEQVGDELVFTGSMITSGGGTRMPMGFVARPADDGTISGEVFFGREMSPEKLEEMRGKGRSFSGASRATSLAASAGG